MVAKRFYKSLRYEETNTDQDWVEASTIFEELPITPVAKGSESVANGGIVSHNLGLIPTVVSLTPSIAGEIVAVTAKTATTFTVAITKHDGTAGTTQTIDWRAEV